MTQFMQKSFSVYANSKGKEYLCDTCGKPGKYFIVGKGKQTCNVCAAQEKVMYCVKPECKQTGGYPFKCGGCKKGQIKNKVRG